MNAGLRLQAQWELEVSTRIFRRRKKVLFLACLPLFIPIVFNLALAESIPTLIPILGGSKAYFPSFVTPIMFYGSILVGLLAGLITGVIGAGGGYILTPALMSLGVKGIMAVGTDQFHLFAKAIIGTAIHRKLGNVNARLAAWFVGGSFFGVTLGGIINRKVYQLSPALSDALISSTYVVVLGLLGIYALADWLRLRRPGGGGARSATEATTQLARWLQSIPLRPRVRFDEDIVPGGRSISVYPIIFCGLVVGFVAAIMGVGGGFLTFPMFVYGLGVSTFTTVGTDILQIIFTTFYSSIFQYAIYGYIFYTVAMGMLLGSLIGVQIGAMVTKMVTGGAIRAFYALTILAGFVNRLCALVRKLADMGFIALPSEITGQIETGGTIVFFLLVAIFGIWILSVFFKNLRSLRTSTQVLPSAGVGNTTPNSSFGPPSRLITDRIRFRLGLTGLVTFSMILVLWLSPLVNQQTGLQWADNLFNQLAKNSTYYIPSGLVRAEKLRGVSVDIGVRSRWPEADSAIIRIIQANDMAARRMGDGRVRIEGDLGLLAKAACVDADFLFSGKESEVARKYGIGGKEVVYYWWTAFDGLSRRYIQENQTVQADFTKFIATRVLEPSYNFAGIQAKDIGENIIPVVLFLSFYILFTLWYGISILFLFEGLGIKATKATEKKEA